MAKGTRSYDWEWKTNVMMQELELRQDQLGKEVEGRNQKALDKIVYLVSYFY